MTQMTVAEALQQAVRCQQAADFATAERLYRAILATAPVEAAVNNLFGLLLQCDRADAAGTLLEPYRDRLPTLTAELAQRLALFTSLAMPDAYLGTVVVPAYQAEAYLAPALDSVLGAIRRLQDRYAGKVLLAVVDDASSDGTSACCRAWAERCGYDDLLLLRHGVNRGAAAARNSGAGAGRGPYLWFLDADDRFLPDHLLLHYELLERWPQTGFVRSSLQFEQIDARIDLTWRVRNELTSVNNLSVRRCCHDFIGGMPEERIFRVSGGEDAAYAQALHGFFVGIYARTQTVAYRRRPGNSLDHQIRALESGSMGDNDRLSDDFRRQQIVGLLASERRMHHLTTATPPAGLPPLRQRRDSVQLLDVEGQPLTVLVG